MGEGSILSNSSFERNGNVRIDSISDENIVLEDLESYLDDLSARLAVSRMVSDSVIKGMVNAVVQEAAENNSSKDAEIAKLNKRLQIYEPDAIANSPSVLSPMMSQVQFKYLDLSRHNGNQLHSLNIAAKKHLQLLKSETESMRSLNYCKLTNMDSRSLGFCCTHDHLKVSDKLTQMHESIDALGVIFPTICEHTEVISSLKDSLCEQQWHCEFQKEIDCIIVQGLMRDLREEFDMKLCKQKSLFDIQNKFWSKKVDDLSSLHQELDSFSKSLLCIEPEHPLSHGSHESSEEWNSNKRKDQFPHKVCRDNVSTGTSHMRENGFVSIEKSEKVIPETADSSLLLHLSREELISHYKTEINKVKRQLESSLHETTEELFRLKREFLKGRGSLHCRRDKDVEALKKKIPEILFKMDKVHLEAKNFSAVQDHHDKTCIFKQRIEDLLCENRHLHELLVDRNKEVECLSSKVSDTANQISNYSAMEANLLKKVKKLKWEIEDVKAEAFTKNQVDRCIINELMHEVTYQMENMHIENLMIEEFYGIVLRGSIVDICSSMNCIMIHDEEKKILTEVISQKEKALNLEAEKAEQLKQGVASLSSLINEKESALLLEVKKTEKLNQEIISLLALIKEKNNFISEIESKLVQQKKQLDVFSEELDRLKDQSSMQQKLISEDKRESSLSRARLDEALSQIQQSNAKIYDLNQRLTVVSSNLKEAENQKAILCEIIQQKQSEISSVSAQLDEQTEQLESIVIFVEALSKSVAEFEHAVMWNIERRSSRLKTLGYQCDALLKQAGNLKGRELWCKKKLEIRTSDLEKAEIEVDLLGDEVDALLNILEKIYIALDHYSPVLQHYPGVMEILKLVRRELRGSD